MRVCCSNTHSSSIDGGTLFDIANGVSINLRPIWANNYYYYYRSDCDTVDPIQPTAPP